MSCVIKPHDELQVVTNKEQELTLCAAIIVDTIWFGRNDKVHHEKEPHDVMDMTRKVKYCRLEEYRDARKAENIERGRYWIPAEKDRCKINYDAAVKSQALGYSSGV